MTVHRAQPGRQNPEAASSFDRMAKNPFGHGAAANVSSANKQNGLHECVNHAKVGRVKKIVNGEIRANEIDGQLRALLTNPAPAPKPGRELPAAKLQ